MLLNISQCTGQFPQRCVFLKCRLVPGLRNPEVGVDEAPVGESIPFQQPGTHVLTCRQAVCYFCDLFTS